ncbi:MAG: DUF302 domain-containing protein [Bacteroidales bacterium]
MDYTINKKIIADFDSAIERVTEELQKEGFGVLSDIDMRQKFRDKLEVDFRHYRILGVCHPPSAYRAVQEDDKIGTMLPCSLIVQQSDNDQVEIAVIDPVVTMGFLENKELDEVAHEIREKLRRVIAAL